MLSKETTISAYYLLTILTLGLMMIYTLYQSSRAVSYGQRISELEKQKQELVVKQTKLEQELAESKSITKLKNTDTLAPYQPITNPLTLTTLHSTASP